MSRILPLSTDAISQIHSSKNITSLQGVVVSLLENCLDAGATKVDVEVDFPRGGCTIEDNGTGIPTAEFGANGGLGRMYHTSKRDPSAASELHGSSGTYLASLAALSLLIITSRHRDCEEAATLVMHRGKVVSRHAPAPQSYALSSAHGTQVTIRDLFGNMPVRVKQRALAGETGREDERAWQELKRGVIATLLTWPSPCAIKLHDAHFESRGVTLSTQAGNNSALTEKTLNQLAGKPIRSDVRDALPMLFQADLAAHESRHRWIAVSASAASVSVRGAICLDPAPNKQCQFASIGIHPCSAESGHNELYDAINKVFANSSFGAMNDAPDVDDAEKDRRKLDRRYKKDGYTQKQLLGRKGVDRWAMFVLQVKLKDGLGHQTAVNCTSDASLKAVVDVLEATVIQWLAAHHFRPKKRRRRRNEDQPGPAVASSSPMRRASTADGRSARAGSDMFGTPVVKRAATAISASTTKKRKIVDLFEVPRSRGQDTARDRPSGYFDGLSRIKSGRMSLHETVTDKDKLSRAPASLSTGEPELAEEQLGIPVKHPFKLAPLEAGELSLVRCPRQTVNQAMLPAFDSPSVPEEAYKVVELEAVLTSDDLGSVDDAALLDAAETAERDSISQAGGAATILDIPSEAAKTNDSVMNWTDPVSKQTYQVNARTGVVLPWRAKSGQLAHRHSGDQSPRAGRHKAAIDTTMSSNGQPLSLARRKLSTPLSKDRNWLPGFLEDWKNPVFARQNDEPIPVASFDGPGLDPYEADNHRCTSHSMTQCFAETGQKGVSKLSKAALKQARVIRQVDQKFILCSLSDGRGADAARPLVLVDQHAASERVILERLLAELCAPVSPDLVSGAYQTSTGCHSSISAVVLEQPQRFLVPEKESKLLATHAQHFATWGVLYDLTERVMVVTASQVREPAAEHKVTIRTLPPGIAERCTLFPKLLIELLRSEVWSIAQSPNRPPSLLGANNAGHTEHSWLARIGSCPKGIVEMLNSRACRSAIMFNDILSVDECKTLLADLSRCAFPFMCAHGRVSMVPLVKLGGNGDLGGFGVNEDGTTGRGANGQQAKFAQAFRDWKRVDSECNEGIVD